MKILVAVGIAALAGLAGTSSAALADPGEQPGARPASPDDGVLGFPARLRSDLGRAHQIGSAVARRGAALVAQVLVCVVPSGAVTDVKLMKGSGRRTFDTAVVDSATRWIYAPYPAPAGTRVCSAVSVVYRAPLRVADRPRP